MRLLNQDDDKPLHRVLILLTQPEALELRDSLDLLFENSVGRHEHISSQDYQKEITIGIYEERKPEGFDERSRILIARDE